MGVKLKIQPTMNNLLGRNKEGLFGSKLCLKRVLSFLDNLAMKMYISVKPNIGIWIFRSPIRPSANPKRDILSPNDLRSKEWLPTKSLDLWCFMSAAGTTACFYSSVTWGRKSKPLIMLAGDVNSAGIDRGSQTRAKGHNLCDWRSC